MSLAKTPRAQKEPANHSSCLASFAPLRETRPLILGFCILLCQSSSAAMPAQPLPAGQLTRELWSSRLAAPDPNEDAETRLALKRLIRQVRSVRFGSEAASAAPAAPVPTPPTPAPRQIEPAPVPPVQPPETTAADRPHSGPSDRTANAPAGPSPSGSQQKALAILLQDAGRTRDPLEIAELLFLSGRPADAAPFYAQALEHLPPGEAATVADRTWTLFQLANCLRETSPGEAQATYARLLAEYPDSPWTELARAQSQLLGWYQKEQPQQLAASRQP
jgi:hypothetical protein